MGLCLDWPTVLAFVAAGWLGQGLAGWEAQAAQRAPPQPCRSLLCACGSCCWPLLLLAGLSSLHGFWWVLHPCYGLAGCSPGSSHGLLLVGCFLVSSYCCSVVKNLITRQLCLYFKVGGRVVKSFWASDFLNKQQLIRNEASTRKCSAVFRTVWALGVQWHDGSGLSLSC